jgi:uncharacterized alkaline shock family protein YloU
LLKEVKKMKLQTEYGELDITIQALRRLVYLAVMETYGPVNISGESWITKWFGKEEERIRTEEDDFGHIKVDIYLELEYGLKITEVARNIVENVTHKLKTLGGCENAEVNVHVIGIR